MLPKFGLKFTPHIIQRYGRGEVIICEQVRQLAAAAAAADHSVTPYNPAGLEMITPHVQHVLVTQIHAFVFA
jgi:hypothetical protein